MRYLLTFLLLLPSLVLAQELHTFKNGEVADADDLNSSLQLLLEKIEAVEERVTALEPTPPSPSDSEDILQDGVADTQFDLGVYAWDEALDYAGCGNADAGWPLNCVGIAFAIVDDEERGAVLEIRYLANKFGGIAIDTTSPGLDMRRYENGTINFDIKVVSAGANAMYKVKLDDHNGGSTGEFSLGADNSGSWTTYSVNMSELLDNVDGNGVGRTMSLSILKVVAFMATYGATEDVVFRLDNVYFSE